jgi:hypothetical protein
MGNQLLENPDHWRKRADEVLALAELLTDPAERAMMLDIVAGYEKLARRAELGLAWCYSGNSRGP